METVGKAQDQSTMLKNGTIGTKENGREVVYIVETKVCTEYPEPVFVNVCGAKESIPRNRSRQPV